VVLSHAFVADDWLDFQFVCRLTIGLLVNFPTQSAIYRQPLQLVGFAMGNRKGQKKKISRKNEKNLRRQQNIHLLHKIRFHCTLVLLAVGHLIKGNTILLYPIRPPRAKALSGPYGCGKEKKWIIQDATFFGFS